MLDTFTLKNNEILLRPWSSVSDIVCVRKASLEHAITSTTTLDANASIRQAYEWVERQWSRSTEDMGWSWAVCDGEDAVGSLTLIFRPQQGVIGLGYWLVPDVRGKGLAAKAVQLASDWALGVGGFARVEAWTVSDNIASQKTLLACGFEKEGVLRCFLSDGDQDAHVYSRIS